MVIALIALLGLLSEGNGRSFSRFFNEISNVHDMASADASEAAPAQPGPAPPRAADLQDLGDVAIKEFVLQRLPTLSNEKGNKFYVFKDYPENRSKARKPTVLVSRQDLKWKKHFPHGHIFHVDAASIARAIRRAEGTPGWSEAAKQTAMLVHMSNTTTVEIYHELFMFEEIKLHDHVEAFKKDDGGIMLPCPSCESCNFVERGRWNSRRACGLWNTTLLVCLLVVGEKEKEQVAAADPQAGFFWARWFSAIPPEFVKFGPFRPLGSLRVR